MPNLKITQRRSLIGRPEKHRRMLRGLGLTKMHQSVVRPDNDCIRGMIFKVSHLISVEETDEDVTLSRRRRALKAGK